MKKNRIFLFLLISLSLALTQCKWDPIDIKEHCGNSIQDADETGLDCGGATCDPCTGSGVCNSNGVQDNGETGVDCGGGDCPACSAELCDNGVQDPGEDDVDCGCNCPTRCFPTFEKTYSFQAVRYNEGVERSNGTFVLGGSNYIGSLTPFNKDNLKGAILAVDATGNATCKKDNYLFESGENRIFGINARSNDEILAVGFTQTDGGYDASTLLISGSSSCSGGSLNSHNNFVTLGPGEEKWEQGNCIIIDRNDQNPVVAGTWKGYPSLIKYTNGLDGNVEWQKVYDPAFFMSETSENLRPAWENSKSAGHTAQKTIQLADGSFMTTGYVILKNGVELIRAPFLVKSKSNGDTERAKIYSTNAIGGSIFGRKNAEGLDLLEVGGKVILAGYGFDELPNQGDPNVLECDDFIGFIAQIDPSDLSMEIYEEVLNSGGVDKVTALVKGPMTDQFLITGVTLINSTGNTTHAMVIEDYFVSPALGEFEFPEGDIEETYSKSGDFAEAKDIIATSDGGYLLIGGLKNNCKGFGDLYLVKTNSQGQVCN